MATEPARAKRIRATPCGLDEDPHINLTQRTLLWTCEAAGVTARFDEVVPGRMYSGMACSCSCLTMQAPVWYPISPGP